MGDKWLNPILFHYAILRIFQNYTEIKHGRGASPCLCYAVFIRFYFTVIYAPSPALRVIVNLPV